MIDLHTHVLPAIDDGARDLDETLAMLQMAAEEGIRTVVATPHYDCLDPEFPALVADRLEQVRAAVSARRLPVRILKGFELELTSSLVARGTDARALGLNGSRYLLVELPTRFWPPFAHEALFRLQGAGLCPILAHAERYEPLVREPQLAEDLVRRGLLLQINAHSLTGQAGRQLQRAARKLLLKGFVTLLASDAHSTRHRTCRLRAAVDVAARLVGRAAAERLVWTNPAAIVNNLVLPEQPPPTTLRSRFFLA